MYFNHLHTVEDIKREYRRLAWLHHPDRDGGDTATMQRINAEYEMALKRCDGQTSQGSDGKDHTYHYDQKKERDLIDKINELLSLKLEDINIWLVGTWLWIDGDTKPHREALKAAWGSFVGFLMGVGMKLMTCGTILFFFIRHLFF